MIVLKIGGSAFDLGAQTILPLAAEIREISRREFVVVTVGGGPPLDTLKDARDTYGLPDLVFESLAPSFISVQAHIIESLIPCRYLQPHELGATSEPLTSDGAVVLTHSLDLSIRPSESDAHTLKIAEFLGVEEVLFAKDAEGIFDRDPKLGGSHLYREITVKDLQNKVSRMGGDGRDEHLIENRALDILEHSLILKAVALVDCKTPEALRDYVQDRRALSRIVKST